MTCAPWGRTTLDGSKITQNSTKAATKKLNKPPITVAKTVIAE
jgi:hypothetical protein